MWLVSSEQCEGVQGPLSIKYYVYIEYRGGRAAPSVLYVNIIFDAKGALDPLALLTGHQPHLSLLTWSWWSAASGLNLRPRQQIQNRRPGTPRSQARRGARDASCTGGPDRAEQSDEFIGLLGAIGSTRA